MASPWPGRCEGLPRRGPDITTHPQASIAGLGWQHRQKHQHPRAGRASFPTETCKQSRGYSIFFPQDFSERNHQDVTQEVVFFFFHGNLSQHYRLLKDISEKENNGHQRAKMILWLAGLAPGFGRLASTSNNFFLGLGASSGLTLSFPLSLRWIPE